MSNRKEFGGFGWSVMVYTREAGPLDDEPRIDVSWSMGGAKGIERAIEFRDALNEAIAYAKSEAVRIGLRPEWERVKGGQP